MQPTTRIQLGFPASLSRAASSPANSSLALDAVVGPGASPTSSHVRALWLGIVANTRVITWLGTGRSFEPQGPDIPGNRMLGNGQSASPGTELVCSGQSVGRGR